MGLSVAVLEVQMLKKIDFADEIDKNAQLKNCKLIYPKNKSPNQSQIR